jgi:uncharacterized phage protein (TIGR01671 family)
MKRIIKFRAWHKELKDMTFPNNKFFYSKLIKYSEMYELMQFTGLHDKNGKEIYEGDIVKWVSKFKGTEILTPEKTGQIKYNEQGCIFHIDYELNKKQYYKELIADYGDEDGYMMTSIEIIGNINENPELLNQSK